MEDKGNTDNTATDEFLRDQDRIDAHCKNATADGQQKQIEEEPFQGLGSAWFAFNTFKLIVCHVSLIPWRSGGTVGGETLFVDCEPRQPINHFQQF